MSTLRMTGSLWMVQHIEGYSRYLRPRNFYDFIYREMCQKKGEE